MSGEGRGKGEGKEWRGRGGGWEIRMCLYQKVTYQEEEWSEDKG